MSKNNTLYNKPNTEGFYKSQGNDILKDAREDVLLPESFNEETSVKKTEAKDISYHYDDPDTLYANGGRNSTVFAFDINETASDSQEDIGTMKILDSSFDFSTLENIIENVEFIDLEKGANLTLGSDFIRNVNGQDYTMKIDGDFSSQVTFENIFVNTGIEIIHNKSYNTYSLNDTTIHVESDVTVIMP